MINELTYQNILAFLVDAFTPDAFSRRKTTHRTGATAWLDGLRGWAALIVCYMHLTVYTHDGLETCYGNQIGPDAFNTSPIALPIIRIPFVGGHFIVMLFFAISGYVVPRRLINLLNEGRRDDFYAAFHSVLIRRPVRLFAPVVMSTFLFYNSWHIFRIDTPWPNHQSNILFEFYNWVKDMLQFFFIYRIGYLFTWYNVHTWTIPVEYRGTMFLVVWLFFFHHVSTKLRVELTLAFTLYLAIGCAGATHACFFGGMFLCEVDMCKADPVLSQIKFPWDGIDQWFKKRKIIRGISLHLLLLVGLYFASQPSTDWLTRHDTLGICPGWKTLGWMIPSAYIDDHSAFRWFWLFWASWIIIYCVKEISWARGLFEGKLAQYLGRHSFALYLVHGPMIGILSERLFYLTGVKTPLYPQEQKMFGHLYNQWHDASWWPFPDGGPLGLEPNFLVCVAISMPIFMYCAEVGTKLFDLPSVKISRYADQYVMSLRQ